MEKEVNSANAKQVGKLVQNMDEEEYKAIVKNIPSSLMFDELARRNSQMTEMIKNIRQIAQVGCTDEAT